MRSPVLLVLSVILLPSLLRADLVFEGVLVNAADTYSAHVLLDDTNYRFWCAPSVILPQGPTRSGHRPKLASSLLARRAIAVGISDKTSSPLADHRTGNPSVPSDSFIYQSTSCSWALYRSADDLGPFRGLSRA